MIPKEPWLQNIIDSFKEIGSAEFQEKGWVKNEMGVSTWWCILSFKLRKINKAIRAHRRRSKSLSTVISQQ